MQINQQGCLRIYICTYIAPYIVLGTPVYIYLLGLYFDTLGTPDHPIPFISNYSSHGITKISSQSTVSFCQKACLDPSQNSVKQVVGSFVITFRYADVRQTL